MRLLLRPGSFDFVFRGKNGAAANLSVELLGANPEPEILPSERLASESNYFIGRNSANWLGHVPNFARITYRDAYPGVALAFYGRGKDVENDFIVRPGADYREIRMRISGAENISAGADGWLKISLRDGQLTLGRPDVYQKYGRHRRARLGRWKRLGKDEVGFEIGSYDPQQDLIIDPILDYSTYLADVSLYMQGIATDQAGNTYVTGQDFSGMYPTTQGSFQPACKACPLGNPNIFISKVSEDGSSLVYSTYLGGSNYDQPSGIAVDANGNTIVVGRTSSTDFPTKNQISGGGSTNLYTDFITSLSPDGSSLNYSSLLQGGVCVDAVALDPQGAAYMSGCTDTANFPVTPGALNNAVPAYPKFVVYLSKILPSGSLGYSALLGDASPQTGGGGLIGVAALAVDAHGDAFVAGAGGTLWPTTNQAYQNQILGPDQYAAPFVAKVAPDASSFVYSTYLGSQATLTGIAVNENGNAYVTGWGAASNFPTTSNAYQKTIGNFLIDSIFSELSPDGSQLVYSSFFPQTADITDLFSIALDPSGNIWLGGITRDAGMPLVSPLQTLGPGDIVSLPGSFWTGAVAEFDPAGANLLFSTFFGDLSEGAAVLLLATDPGGKVHLAGETGYLLYTSPSAYRGTVDPPPPNNFYNYGFAATLDPSVEAPAVCIGYPENVGVIFGSPSPVFVGGTYMETLTFRSCGGLPLDISAITNSNPAFGLQGSSACLQSLVPGASCTLTIIFQPLLPQGYASLLKITSNAPIPTFRLPVVGIVQNITSSPDFSFGAVPPDPTLTIASPGSDSAAVTLDVVAQNGFSGTVNFSSTSCTITPAGSGGSCSFTPSSVSGSGTTQVVVHTVAPQSATFYRYRSPHGPATEFRNSFMAIAGFTLLLIFFMRSNRRHSISVCALILVALAAICYACGGNSGSSTNAGVGASGTPTNILYTVTVNATSGQLSHSTSFQFIVQ